MAPLLRQVVILTFFLALNRNKDVAQAALDTGAKGYRLRTDTESELWTALEAVLQGKRYVSSGLDGYQHSC
jgi:DNA-binding NarL/FixJ family response regulator